LSAELGDVADYAARPAAASKFEHEETKHTKATKHLKRGRAFLAVGGSCQENKKIQDGPTNEHKDEAA
jgi:hypothetical protein